MCTLALLINGFIDYNSYDWELCPSKNRYKVGVDGGRRLGHPPGPDFEQYGDDRCMQDPPIPPALLAVFDFGWFGILCTTAMFLPMSGTIKVNYEVEAVEEKLLKAKFKAVGKIRQSGNKRSKSTTGISKSDSSLGEGSMCPAEASVSAAPHAQESTADRAQIELPVSAIKLTSLAKQAIAATEAGAPSAGCSSPAASAPVASAQADSKV